MTGVGITYPIFSASSCFKLWNATPHTIPLELNAGPPLLPLLIAASICRLNNSVRTCAYWVTSTLLTTPLVTDIATPPIGYPTTVTLSCNFGNAPNFNGVMFSKNFSSSTDNNAKSHSVPIANTLAINFLSDPLFFNLTCVECSTECAFVNIRFPSTTKPVLVEGICLFLCHGKE